jgi:DNA-directed RNA polymerase specialized sigma24 family protein
MEQGQLGLSSPPRDDLKTRTSVLLRSLYERLYCSYEAVVLRHVRVRWSLSETDAEDVVQQTFLNAYQYAKTHKKQFARTLRVKAQWSWLKMIADRIVIDEFRRSRSKPTTEMPEGWNPPDPKPNQELSYYWGQLERIQREFHLRQPATQRRRTSCTRTAGYLRKHRMKKRWITFIRPIVARCGEASGGQTAKPTLRPAA